MARQGRARAAALAALMAITLVVPSVAARADLLGGVTDWVDDTVDDTTDLVDETVDTTEDIVDNTIGDTGTGLDETVDSLTDTVDTVSDELSGAVDDTTETATDTLQGVTDAVTDTFEEPPSTDDGSTDPPTTTTTVRTTTTTTASSAGRATTSPTTTTTTTVPRSAADANATSDEDRTEAIIADRNSPSGGSGLSGEVLTVLSVAGGLTDPSILEPVRFVALPDESLYGRLLDWLVGAGSGLLGLLAGPLLALEILLRALLSAGSGLVAPASLLVSYLGRLLWESRGRASRSVPAA